MLQNKIKYFFQPQDYLHLDVVLNLASNLIKQMTMMLTMPIATLKRTLGFFQEYRF